MELSSTCACRASECEQVARKPTQRSRPDEHQVQCVRPARTVAWNGNTQSMHESALFVEPTKERSFACAATERLTAHTCTANPTKCDVERPARTHSDVERQFTTRDDARQADTKKRSFMPERERRVRTATTPTVVHGAAALMIECALARQRARRSTDASKHSRESRHGCRKCTHAHRATSATAPRRPHEQCAQRTFIHVAIDGVLTRHEGAPMHALHEPVSGGSAATPILTRLTTLTGHRVEQHNAVMCVSQTNFK